MRSAEVGVEDPKVQGTQYVGASNGETGERRTSSAKASARVQDPQVRTKAKGPEVQGTQRVGASNAEITLTLGGSGERRASSAKASARVQDPEARKKAKGREVQSTQYVGSSNVGETLTLGVKGMRTSSAAASARVEDPEECTGAQGPEVQGILEGAEIVVLSSTSIASTQVELSTNFLDLIRQAGKNDPDSVATRDAALKRQNGDSEVNVADDLLFYENRWVIPADSALRLRILHENHDSKVAGHFGQFKTAERMKQNFYWPKMDDDARDYVRSCDTCLSSADRWSDREGKRGSGGLSQALWLVSAG
jgi:hypothetical protein